MYLSIIIFPLLGSVASGFLGRKIGVTGSHFISCVCLGISSILIATAFYEVCLCNSPVFVNLGSWIESELLTISWEFIFDQLTVSLALAVLFCSTLIHIYSIYYLPSDPALCLGKTQFLNKEWEKLPNSGDTLKLIIPNYNRKVLSGQSNYLGMVKSYKMSENEMGNRGSKSDMLFNNVSVKEQRVDGSYFGNINYPKLRYTLTGFERNYQIKIPSKQLNKKYFSTFNSSLIDINPWFWSGLIDGEGSFSIIIDRNKKRQIGWRVQSKFQIGLHKRDLSLLLQLQQYLGGIGSIHTYPTRDIAIYSIDSNKDLAKLIDHFEKFPLLTQKKADFILFKQAIKLINNKSHLSIEGLHQIINIKASMNLGLSESLKNEFYDLSLSAAVERPVIKTEKIPDPNWISGFVTGDGGFDVNIPKSNHKIGYRVQLRFRITQHERDIKLMECLINYLDSGQIYKYPDKPAVSLIVVNFSQINNKIIPFFKKYPLHGIKLFDFRDWCKIAKLMSDGKHLTLEGLNIIKTIKSGMNKGRNFTNI